MYNTIEDYFLLQLVFYLLFPNENNLINYSNKSKTKQ